MLRKWIRRVESGSVEGDFSFTIYTPFLVAVLLVGIFFALIGFWRVGASYASERGAQVGAVAPGVGNAALKAFFLGWTNGSSDSDSIFGVSTSGRITTATVNTSKQFDYGGFGLWDFSIDAQTQMRSERFYPGGPACDGGECNE